MLGFIFLRENNMESHCVYILYSEAINRFYIGYSANFDMRMEFHQFPESRKFTAKAQDWRFFLKFDCDSKKQALNIEKHIKTMKRDQEQLLCLQKLLSIYKGRILHS